MQALLSLACLTDLKLVLVYFSSFYYNGVCLTTIVSKCAIEIRFDLT